MVFCSRRVTAADGPVDVEICNGEADVIEASYL